MFKFMQNKVYRKMFINFTVIFFLIISLFTFIVYGQIYENKKQVFMRNNKYASEYVESVIEMKQSEIDAKLNKIYNNDKSLNDVVNFFTLDMDEYLASKLDAYKLFEYYPTINKFAEDCIYNDKDITRVILYDHVKERMMVYFNDYGLFLKTWTESDPSKPYDIIQDAGGFLITREISDPSTLDTLCSIYITFDDKSAFDSIERFNSTDIILANDSSYIILNDEIQSPYVAKNIDYLIKQQDMEGEIATGLFNKVYYSTHLIVGQNYKIMTFIDTATINIEGFNILIILLIAIGVFIAAELFVASKINRESRDLDNIITSIQSAKSGSFIPSNAIYREDELGIIANELNDMIVKLDNYIKREYKLKLEQKQMQFELLQTQINPHFLYNTLEIMKAKALLNSDAEVAGAISNLGGLYRDLLTFDSIIPLRDELRLAKHYLDMMSFIYDENFFYTIDVDEDVLDFKTIKFWIQTLIENFFVHGMNKDNYMNALIIRGYRSDNKIFFEVQDNGVGMEPDKIKKINENLISGNNTNIGLNNVYKRLKLYHGENVFMQILDNKEAGITVRIVFEEDNSV